jgi:DNA-binding NtrC family response regulator
VLLRHDWPGNVRELENVIERAVVLARGRDLTTDELPPALSGPSPKGTSTAGFIPGASWREIEREAILRTLEIVEGSTSRAAAMLGISPRKIQYRLKEYSLDSSPPAAEESVAQTPGQPPRQGN